MIEGLKDAPAVCVEFSHEAGQFGLGHITPETAKALLVHLSPPYWPEVAQVVRCLEYIAGENKHTPTYPQP